MDVKGKFIELLRSDIYRIRSHAWDKVDTLIDKGIITEEDVMDVKSKFIELLRSDNKDVRSVAWDKVDTLIDKGIITKEDTEK